MANIVREELWRHPGFPGMIVVTTNATIRYAGSLVMGCGAALQAVKRIPGIDMECGQAVKAAIDRSVLNYQLAGEPAPSQYAWAGYYFLAVRHPKPKEMKVGFGIFQVKVHYSQRAELELIRRSTSMLDKYARHHSGTQIRMNYPGIGAGRLPRGKIEPLLKKLPDNVTICWR